LFLEFLKILEFFLNYAYSCSVLGFMFICSEVISTATLETFVLWLLAQTSGTPTQFIWDKLTLTLNSSNSSCETHFCSGEHSALWLKCCFWCA